MYLHHTIDCDTQLSCLTSCSIIFRKSIISDITLITYWHTWSKICWFLQSYWPRQYPHTTAVLNFPHTLSMIFEASLMLSAIRLENNKVQEKENTIVLQYLLPCITNQCLISLDFPKVFDKVHHSCLPHIAEYYYMVVLYSTISSKNSLTALLFHKQPTSGYNKQ